MTVETTDCTPDGKRLCDCSNAELLETAQNIDSYGMLRMHAHSRLMNRVDQEIQDRGYGWYHYDNDRTPWEKEVGVKWSIAKGGQQVRDEDHHECLACWNSTHRIFHVFPVLGPLTETVKARITQEMNALIEEAKAKQAAWEAERAKNPEPKTYFITGRCGPIL